MHTNRITVEEVKAAIERTGMKPIKGEYIDHLTNCGCGIGILAVASRTPPDSKRISDWANSVYGQPYHRGFHVGFDGEPYTDCVMIPSWEEGDEARCYQGYQDGSAVAAALFQEQGA